MTGREHPAWCTPEWCEQLDPDRTGWHGTGLLRSPTGEVTVYAEQVPGTDRPTFGVDGRLDPLDLDTTRWLHETLARLLALIDGAPS